MPAASFACPACKTAFDIEPGTEHIEAVCPTCNAGLEAYFFPAFYRATPVGTAAVALADHTEASCFYHPQKQAGRVCDSCGRLICSLCSIELGAEHLCPNCLSSGKKKGKLTTLENTRTKYDSIALTLAAVGIFVSFFAFITAPAAIYISIRHWNSPGSLMGTSRLRFVVAIILAVVELLGWGTLLLFAFIGATVAKGHH
jgi:hypothetical protein